ncbi:hypothetical protein BDZ97DRAFT_1840903 [Flammula alnicola]|nr:hypothetical protein BDZ97DRAFT_1840903 [Flammula alnicola]
MAVDIPRTFGALLIGGVTASLLSGLVVVQIVIYFKLYPGDLTYLKALVLAVWFLDTFHTALIWSGLWNYLISNYGARNFGNNIPWNIAFSVVTTAILTFFVHIFFAHRIFMLSRKNYWVTVPIIILATLRLLAASVSTSEMLHLKTFMSFRAEVQWVFTTGLALSSAVDILVTASLFILLHTSRTGAANLNAMIDSLIRFAFETGSLTCAGTVISMICWLSMPTNLIWLGLHFVIGKLYANSLLVTLNTRDQIRRSQATDYPAAVIVDTLHRRSVYPDHFAALIGFTALWCARVEGI